VNVLKNSALKFLNEVSLMLQKVFWSFVTLLLIGSSLAAQDVLIRNVSVIDVANGSVRPRMNVLVGGGKIKNVSSANIRTDARVIDGAGKFLIPGLWEMHAHDYEKESLFYLYIASGVTGVRDMGAPLKPLRQWESEVKAGKMIGPRLQAAAGSPINRPNPNADPRIPETSVTTTAEGRTAVEKLHEMGADFIKPYSPPRDAYFGAVKRAHELGMPVAGHLPADISLREAIDAGQVSIEHLPISLSCSSMEADVMKARMDAAKTGTKALVAPSRQQLIDTFDEAHCRQNLEYMRSHNVRITPTLAPGMIRNDIRCGAAMQYPTLKYVPEFLLKSWEPKTPAPPCTAAELEQQRKDFEYTSTLIKMLKSVGVGIMAGTDSGDPYRVTGFVLHQELQYLVKAGLTPAEALRSATLEPAKFFGLEKTLGSVEMGKVADLVLVNASPLADISNTLRIDSVFVNGRLFDRVALDGMLAEKK
jgi:imidazolonepropionase-like amidohydrolase